MEARIITMSPCKCFLADIPLARLWGERLYKASLNACNRDRRLRANPQTKYGPKYGPTCYQWYHADVTNVFTLVRLSPHRQRCWRSDVMALSHYKRRKSALTANPIADVISCQLICFGIRRCVSLWEEGYAAMAVMTTRSTKVIISPSRLLYLLIMCTSAMLSVKTRIRLLDSLGPHSCRVRPQEEISATWYFDTTTHSAIFHRTKFFERGRHTLIRVIGKQSHCCRSLPLIRKKHGSAIELLKEAFPGLQILPSRLIESDVIKKPWDSYREIQEGPQKCPARHDDFTDKIKEADKRLKVSQFSRSPSQHALNYLPTFLDLVFRQSSLHPNSVPFDARTNQTLGLRPPPLFSHSQLVPPAYHISVGNEQGRTKRGTVVPKENHPRYV